MPDNEADVDMRMDVDTPNVSSLEIRASRLARSHVASRRPGIRPSPMERLEAQETLLREAYKHFAQPSEAPGILSYAAEWLLDNFYVVQQAVRQIREDMPTGYYRRLPKLESTPLEGYPRVYILDLDLVEHSEGRLDMDQVIHFVRAHQTVTPLTMGELWALPTMLRLGILELLSQSIARVLEEDTGKAEGYLALVTLADDQAEDTIVANCITSLRTLSTQDWNAFFEDVSRVEEVLRSEPAGIHARMDFDTRDRYRKVVEEE